MALSSCEHVFKTVIAASCQVLWLRNLLSKETRRELKLVTLFIDNKSVIALIKNPVFHGRSKYIVTRFHFIYEFVEKKQILLEFVCIREQRADILTKALARVKFTETQELLGVKNLEPCQVYRGDCELINLN